MILAAGKGSRLKNLDLSLPKPMIKFKGKPILEHNIDLCKSFGIKEIYINTHYLADKIKNYFGDGSKFGVKITYSYESFLIGTAGALNNFRIFLNQTPFFVIYGDNYHQFDLMALVNKQKETDAIAIIGFHWKENVTESGVAEFDDNGKILRFIEKPKYGETTSKWVNAGIYYLHPKIFDFIPEGFSDFGRDIFPKLIENNIPLFGVFYFEELYSFDTPDQLIKNKGNYET